MNRFAQTAGTLSAYCVFLVAASPSAFSQTTATPQDVTVILSPFEVTASGPSPYQASESTAGGRVAVSTFQSTQGVDVITSSLIADLGADHMLDAVQYVSPGISNGSQSVGADRVNIRGFQSDLHVYDGFQDTNLNKGFPQILESYEIVKGPNVILSPFAPQPGGTIDYITKKPSFSGDFGSVSVEFGQTDSDFGSIDINRVISKTLAARIVVVGVDDSAYTGEPRRGYEVMPEIEWSKGDAKLLVQAQIYNYDTLVNGGVPASYNIGTNSSVSAKDMLPPGVPWDAYLTDADDVRDDVEHNYLAIFTDNLNENLSVRLAAHVNLTSEHYVQFNTSGVVGAPSIASETNPLTGAYTPGIKYGNAASGFAATQVPLANQTGAVWNRSASSQVSPFAEYDFQNDWSYVKNTSFLKSSTTGGIALTYEPGDQNRNETLPNNGGIKVPFDPASFVGSTATFNTTAITQDTLTDEQVTQIYVNEILKFWNDRIIINGGISEDYMRKSIVNVAFPAPSVNPLQPNPSSVDPNKLLKNYGIVITPLPFFDLYYGHGETSLPVTVVNSPTSSATTPSSGNGLLPSTQDSKGDEAGIRFKSFDGRATASVDYFQISQTNYSIPNPLNLSLPPGQAAYPNAFANEISRGWEYEVNVDLNKDLAIVGNYTNYKIANAYGQAIRAAAESSGAIYLNYKVPETTVKGLSFGVGVIHVSKRSAESPTTGSTAAGTAAAPVVYQPSLWLPAYTVVNLNTSYRVNSQWMVHAYMDNALNEYYFTGSLNRYDLFSGALRGYRASLTYSF
jgi:iron complex outermembrane receptor protein